MGQAGITNDWGDSNEGAGSSTAMMIDAVRVVEPGTTSNHAISHWGDKKIWSAVNDMNQQIETTTYPA